MTPKGIRNMVNDGDTPSFAQISEAFPEHHGISWHMRMAAQGSIPDAIMVNQMLLGKNGRWHIGYDCKATASVADGPEYQCISVTPGHALVIATLDAFIAG